MLNPADGMGVDLVRHGRRQVALCCGADDDDEWKSEVIGLDTPRPPIPVPPELRNLVERAVVRWREERRKPVSGPMRELAGAIESERLRVAYQPIVDLLDRRTVAIEALIRLDTPGYAELSNPPAIIEVAESSGLIGALGTHVLAQSCAQLAHWRREAAPDLQVHVNVSPLELRDPRYLDVVNRILRVCQLPTDALVLEITETAALEHDGASQRNLLALSSLGIEIALDDFGTGFASLDLLAATPTRKLKLDRSFIASIGANDDTVRGRGVVVQAAIGLGRSLGLDIVGEGVETDEQAHTLLAWGCQYGQGYLFDKAVRPEELDLRAATALRSSALARTVDSGRVLSPEATDLALSLATVFSSTDEDGGQLRQYAAGAAKVLGGVLGDSRNLVDTAILLAGIADTPEKLKQLGPEATCNVAGTELLDLLRIPPTIGRRTPPGAIARTAWALASARLAGDDAYDPVLLAAHPDPRVDATLRQQVDAWWANPTTVTRHRTDLRSFDQRVRGQDDAATRLRALIGLAQAIGSTGSLMEVLELTAEEARRALGCASLSVSRWERDLGILRTLINVGDLASWEERLPEDEVYQVRRYPEIAQQLVDREMSIENLDEPTSSPGRREMLERTGKGSAATIPIIIDDVVWGECFVASAIGDPPFTIADGPFLSAVASFVGIAISRAEDIGRLARMVHEDPLTRVANRRRLEEHVASLLADPDRDTPLALLMIDVDGLKQINDEFGHAAGDDLLVTVADALERASLSETNALAGRLGGDEFCLAMTADGEHARQVIQRVQYRLSESAPPQPRLSVGIGVNHGDAETFGELLERADAAQYAAKRRGVSVVLDEDADALLASAKGESHEGRRRHRDAPHRQLPGVSERWADQLEAATTTNRDGLIALGELAVSLLDLNRWTLSVVQPGSTRLTVERLQLRRARPDGPPSPSTEESFELQDLPATAEALRTGELALSVDVGPTGVAERQFLIDHGLDYVIGVARTDPDGTRWLLELFGDARSVPFRSCQPLVAAIRDATFDERTAITPPHVVRG